MATTTSNPVITCQRHEKGKPPKAEFACLSCEAYLCPACDGAKHKGDAKSHYRFPTSQLKSYIVFDQPAKPGESHIRRNLAAPKGVVVASHHKATTCYENFQRAVRLFPDRPCLGHRTVKPDGKIGKYSFQSFKEINARVTNLGSGFKALGLQRGDKVGLYSVNRPEWVIAEQACHAYGLLPVPLYDTLGPEAAEQVIHGAGISVVVASLDKLKTLIDIHRKNIVPEFKYAVMMPLQPFDKRIDGPAPNAGGLKVMSFDECEKQGKAAGIPHDPAKPSDLCTLCYTSGTTGAPKGAMLTHTNLMSNIGACVEHGVAAYPTDVHISYLPLAHMFERIVQGLLIGSGCAIGFARGDPLLLLEDIEELKPTIFAGVPRLYNRLFDKIIGTVDQGGGIKKFLFHQGLNSKRQRLVESGQFTHGLWDRLVFGKVAARLGGRVRLMITGSAPIADPVMQFLRCAFSTYVVEGYGQTEATATVTITPMDDQKQAGNVGIPVVCSEVKLVDVPDMGYTSKDIVKGVPAPRGEIWVRGTNVFSGYYKDPERTAESLDEQGWLHSGDIGMWLPDGTLKIIDRKKNIFKLAQGEYIAPEKIENVYGRCKYVAQVFVYGDSLQSTLVAVVVPDEENLKEWHKINKIPVNGTGLQALIQHPTVNPMIMAEMAAVAKAGKLQGFEMVKAIHLHHDLFSVQNNILTPTFKLKRDYARKVFEREIAALYAKIQAQEKEKKSDSKSAL